MNRVQQLTRAARSSTAKFHELRLKYWSSDLDVICCFEGSDDIEFFLPHVRSELGVPENRIDFLNCGGKGVVLALWNWSLARRWSMSRLGFFVDRDLDAYLGVPASGPQLYETDFYSIESYVTSANFFDAVWQDSFRLPMLDTRRVSWRDAYYTGAERLAKLLFPLQYAAVATKRTPGGGVEFDKFKIAEAINVNQAGGVVLTPKRSVNYSAIFVGSVASRTSLRKARLDLAVDNYRLWLRGKFLLWYAMTFFTRMKTSLGARGVPDRAVVKVHFNDEHSIPCLCSRNQRPASLTTFLRNWAALILAVGVAPAVHARS